MAQAPFEFTLQFARGIGSVDAANGILRGVTVAEVGNATGHYAFVDKAGRVLGVGGSDDAAQFKGAAKQLPLAMDEESLKTVVAAATKRVKTREDHNDAIEARAGYAENFRLQDGKVVCDQTIFKAYGNRDVFFETANRTPELIGLSGDFKFNAEVVGDKAMMRVTRVDAVDIVDQGALTHAGLFSVKTAATVDSGGNATDPLTLMAKANAEDMPDFKAFKTLCESVAAYRAKNAEAAAQIDECMALINPVPVKPATEILPAAAATTAMTASEKQTLVSELTTSLSATFAAKLTEAITAAKDEGGKAAKEQLVEFKKQMSALGIKVAELPAVQPDAAAAATAAAAANAPKDFLSLRAAVAKEKNIKLSAAASEVIRDHPEVYREYQVKLGIIKAA